MLVKCMFSGSGGQGSALMAKLVCQGAMKENLKVVMTQTYGIEQRGGDSTANIIISDEPIGSPIVENDATVAVALSNSIYSQCFHGVAPGGQLFTNSSLVEKPGTAEGFEQILVPASEMAVEAGSVRCVNMVMLGAVIARTGMLKRDTITSVLEDTMGKKKPELLELNLKAFNAGYEAAKGD
ncbi:MAG: 2-oxoacid:acceptor oxidoreductase family protein [Desulfovibrionaceae bacterium]|nr:2-oxoacid:acceptor oxidoreductase family protein [Desulfovibrionaceae bacterium]